MLEPFELLVSELNGLERGSLEPFGLAFEPLLELLESEPKRLDRELGREEDLFSSLGRALARGGDDVEGDCDLSPRPGPSLRGVDRLEGAELVLSEPEKREP